MSGFLVPRGRSGALAFMRFSDGRNAGATVPAPARDCQERSRARATARRRSPTRDAPRFRLRSLVGKRIWVGERPMPKQLRSGGGLAAVRYTLARAREAGGIVRLTRRMTAHNACKTCAVGMGGMRNEGGSFPEVCKKSVQAQAA